MKKEYLIITFVDTNLDNDGTIDLSAGDGVFRFTGIAQNSINGNGTQVLDKLEIAKTGSARLLLNRNLDVIGSVNFVSGPIDLNTKFLSMHGTGVLLGENENSRIVGENGGFVHSLQLLNAPVASNPGNLGAMITSTQNLGNTIIRREHQPQTDVNGTGSSIARYYDIIPANNTALNATLRLHYFDAELNGLPETGLECWKASNNINWSSHGFAARDAAVNYVEKSGIGNFSRWTLSLANSALPLVWGLLSTRCLENATRISWETLQGFNTKSFIVQRSHNGAWVDVAVQSAAGHSAVAKQYTYADQQTGNYAYRIVQTDLDGSSTVSSVVYSNCAGNYYFKVYPNPVIQNKVQVTLYVAGRSTVALSVYDNKGVLVKRQQAILQVGINFITVELSSLPAGLYNLMVTMPDGKTESVKLMKL